MLATLQFGNINRGFDLPQGARRSVRSPRVLTFLPPRSRVRCDPQCRTAQNSSPMPTVQPRMLGPNR